MRLPRDVLILSHIFFALSSADTLDCKDVLVDKTHFDLRTLGGEHVVHWVRDEALPTVKNFTFTIDICKPLKKVSHVPAPEQCPSGTNICGIDYHTHVDKNETVADAVVPIAGNYPHHGRHQDVERTRLKGSNSNADSEKEGVRIVMHGGKWPLQGTAGVQQKASIEFLCDPDRTGLEGDEQDDRKHEDGDSNEEEKAKRQEEGGEPEPQTKSLKFISYKEEGDNMKVLRLEWRTKHACEGQSSKPDEGNDPGNNNSHWGFFTWFIIILFLAVSAYLIFGSWLNYNRYGARGWDLIPHGDTIRDIPYIMKDLGRRVVSTVQGGGSRGGYSAV
ncbi:hypothetical protein K402DRAFT_376618 [Aulographum hederae CBS 113979]|uniref:Autophagy-related protein 27 n=1 Tax=Aulographum hederae CBS 113979 TaxID=1176131 RepID=A0A6G1H106_9PEZI|nr:hypothetical protein K402DRAFT_376618 [Aulographum hederae CBS 113979]